MTPRSVVFFALALALPIGCSMRTATLPASDAPRVVEPRIFQSAPPSQWIRLQHTFAQPVAGSDIAVGPDGNVWLADPNNGLIRIDMSGGFTQVGPPGPFGPLRLVAGFSNDIWFTSGFTNPYISRMTLDGTVTQYPLPSKFGYGEGIARGRDKTIWFTDPGSAAIGKIDRNGVMTEYQASSSPMEIVAGPDGNMWFTDYYGGKVGRITPQGVISLFQVARFTRNLVVGPDGDFWVIVDGSAYVYKLSTAGAIVGEVYIAPPGPDGGSAEDIILGPDKKAVWIGWFGGDVQSLERVALDGSITSFPLPQAHFDRMTAGPDKNVWTISLSKTGVEVLVREPVLPAPTSIDFAAVGQAQPVTVAEPGYHGLYAATTSNPAVASVAPGQNAQTFIVTATGSGSCSITLSDARGNGTAVPVTVP